MSADSNLDQKIIDCCIRTMPVGIMTVWCRAHLVLTKSIVLVCEQAVLETWLAGLPSLQIVLSARPYSVSCTLITPSSVTR